MTIYFNSNMWFFPNVFMMQSLAALERGQCWFYKVTWDFSVFLTFILLLPWTEHWLLDTYGKFKMIDTCHFFHGELRSTAFSWTWLSSLSCLFLEWSGNPLCKRAWVLKALIFWTGTPSIFSRNQLPSSGKTPPQEKSMYRVTKALPWMVWAESQPPPVKIPHNKNEYRRVLLPGSFQIL